MDYAGVWAASTPKLCCPAVAMGKFSVQKSCGHAETVKAPASKLQEAMQALRLHNTKPSVTTQPRFPRVADIVVHKRAKAAPRVYKTALKQRVSRRKAVPNSQAAQQDTGNDKRSRSILSMLLKGKSSAKILETECQSQPRVRERVVTRDVYVRNLLRDVKRLIKNRSPWITPPWPATAAVEINEGRKRNGEQLMDAEELLNLCTRPSVFVWDPVAVIPGLIISCPSCGKPASRSNWCPSRPVHQLRGNSIYITVRYGCYACGEIARGKTLSARTRKFFQADATEVLANLPSAIRSQWHFIKAGRALYDVAVADLIRSMATKSSWSALAVAINEIMSAAWAREVQTPYFHLCRAMGVEPMCTQSACPMELQVTDKDVKNLYMTDFSIRHSCMQADFVKEVGDDVLRLDWSSSVATRCGGKHLLYICDGKGRVLVSKLTPTAKPHSAKALIDELHRRGVRPKVAYVDDECCGAWLPVLQTAWPDIHVRLDVMHAIARLTQTTASTHHPCHGRFCTMLSKAIHQPDEDMLQRLVVAWRREHGSNQIPKGIERKIVPRSIRTPSAIERNIDAILADQSLNSHIYGPLLTGATQKSWSNLRGHVMKGCLSDPTNMKVAEAGHMVTIGGDCFRVFQSLRGTSPVEGLHAHQKQWLGTFAQHTVDVGEALLRDGAERWNLAKSERTPSVHSAGYDGRSLEEIDESV